MTRAWRSIFLFGALYSTFQVTAAYAVVAVIKHTLGWAA